MANLLGASVLQSSERDPVFRCCYRGGMVHQAVTRQAAAGGAALSYSGTRVFGSGTIAGDCAARLPRGAGVR